MNADMTDRVKRTQRKLRSQTLVQVLEEFDSRIMELDLESRLLKYRKMSGSPFLFFRGSAYLFYFDVGRETFPYRNDPDKPTWIQGDLHFDNFGAFRSERGRIVFDVNDFDEGCLGSYLFDVLRMSVSLFLAMDEKGVPLPERIETVRTYLEAYAAQIRRFADRKDDPRELTFDAKTTAGPVRKLLRKTEKRAASRLLEDITAFEGGTRAFKWSDEIVQPTEAERAMVTAGWEWYVETLDVTLRRPHSYYRIKDIAVKHGSGTASIGLDRFYVLMEGAEGREALDDVVLEIKEVRAPVPAYFMPYEESFWEEFDHQGKRVIATQQAMHHEADPYLGYMTLDGRQFYVRERCPFKKKLKTDKLTEPGDWAEAAACMGRITAKLHARADIDVEHGLLSYHSEDEINRAIGDDREAFCAYLTHRALSYAEQVKEDFVLFREWSASLEAGRTEAEGAE